MTNSTIGKKIEKAKKDFANHVQCQMICSDGSGKPVQGHYMSCPFYISFHDKFNNLGSIKSNIKGSK